MRKEKEQLYKSHTGACGSHPCKGCHVGEGMQPMALVTDLSMAQVSKVKVTKKGRQKQSLILLGGK